MDAQRLHHFLASMPGTAGDHLGRRMAVGMIEAGRAAAGGVLIDLIGVDAIPALVAADAPAPALQAAIQTAVIFRHADLASLIARHGGRPAFAAWCRAAGYASPPGWPETVDIYRGTVAVSPAEAAAGLSWSTSFEMASFYACRFCDAEMTGVTVLRARVPREGIAMALEGTDREYELVPAEAPTEFEVIADHALILEAGLRALRRYQNPPPGSSIFMEKSGQSERVAVEARARMAAVEVPPGASIAR